MVFRRQVEQWRSLAAEYAKGIPVDLILGIISHESGGRPGEKGGRPTRCALVPSSSGPKRVCRALGLMQVVPRNVVSWNKSHPKRIATWETMTGKGTSSARKQIELGVFILRGSFAWLKRYGFAWPSKRLNEEQIRIGLMVYAWGPGNMKPYLDELQEAGRPITAAEIGARWPGLGKPQNQPLRYSRVVWNRSFQSGGVVPGPEYKKRSNDSGWGILAIAAIAAIALGR